MEQLLQYLQNNPVLGFIVYIGGLGTGIIVIYESIKWLLKLVRTVIKSYEPLQAKGVTTEDVQFHLFIISSPLVELGVFLLFCFYFFPNVFNFIIQLKITLLIVAFSIIFISLTIINYKTFSPDKHYEHDENLSTNLVSIISIFNLGVLLICWFLAICFLLIIIILLLISLIAWIFKLL